jgi:protocatechuate 3,4-dioxygenase alpha subunit
VAERTPSQTVGPFFSIGLCERPANELVPRDAPGAIKLAGRVLDGAGEPVGDALVELWHPEVGFGRCATDADGRFEFVVAEPRDAHFEAMVFARGLLRQVVTRMYLPGANDDFLASLTERDRSTLVAEVKGDGSLSFDVHLQGERETAFFAI